VKDSAELVPHLTKEFAESSSGFLIPRAAWATDRAISWIPLGTSRGVPHTWIHHSRRRLQNGAEVTATEEREFMRDLESFHVEVRGWRAIGYSFVIMPSGRIYEGRGWRMRGAHTKNHNGDSYGICFAGNFDEDEPTPLALEACWLLIRFGLASGRLADGSHPTGGHRDTADTTCPGERLFARLPDLRAP
jgi:hypothetical protein